MSCGLRHTAAVSDKGEVWTWGTFPAGLQCYLDRTRAADPPTACTHSTRPSRVGGVEVFGSRPVSVAAGMCHTAAATADGALFMWGVGGDGELGHGDARLRLNKCLFVKMMSPEDLHGHWQRLQTVRFGAGVRELTVSWDREIATGGSLLHASRRSEAPSQKLQSAHDTAPQCRRPAICGHGGAETMGDWVMMTLMTGFVQKCWVASCFKGHR
jgi:hypothetical protein